MAKKIKTLSVAQEDIDFFIKTFKTASTVYAQQYYDKSQDKAVWFRVEKNIDFERDAAEHLAGKKTIGSYVIHVDGENAEQCTWCALDFDIPKKVRSAIESQGTLEEQAEAYQKELNDIKETIKGLLVRLPQLGMTYKQALPEFSGNKGYHVWFFFEQAVPARTAYLFLNGIKSYLDLDKNLEVFPKQAATGGAFGSLIKLPLGVHQATGKRCLFVDIMQDTDDDSAFMSQFQKLKSVEKISLKLIDDVINMSSDTLPIHIRNSGMGTDDRPLDDLSKPPFNADIRELSKKCGALSRLEKKAKEEKHLIHEERLALMSFYIQFGEQGVKKMHKILSSCTDYNKETTDKILQHALDKSYKPVTCGRLQEWHICKKNCSNILKVNGTSPIKFAYKQTKAKLEFNYVEEIETSECVDETVRVPFKVTSMVSGGSAYAVDKEIEMICPHTCPERHKENPKCSYAGGVSKSTDKKVTLKIKPDDPFILRCVGSSIDKMHALEVSMCSIPCIKPKMMKRKVKSYYHVSQILMGSSDQVMRERLFETKISIECKNYLAYYIGSGGIQTGHEYMGVGRILQHPNDCKLTYVITHIEPLLGSLEEFIPNEEEEARIARFRDLPQATKVKTMSEEVCGVKGRDMETFCALLTFFSPLQLKFDGRLLKRGWMETCFIGDTSQGKSHIPEQLMLFAGFNNTIHGGQATEAGILGGVATIDKQQYISWGMLPRCDKTMVFIDELEVLQSKSNALKSLREVRATGIATITKIIHGSRLSRVRLIASANTKKNTTIGSYKRGCQSIMGIMEAPDVRRFDLVCFFQSHQVDAKEIMKARNPTIVDITQADFQTALRFAWTRGANEWIFSEETTKLVYKLAYKLYEKYKGASQSIPIITTDIFQKIARTAAGVAGFTMNTHDMKTIHITEDHALTAYQLMDSIYSSRDVALDKEAEECELKNEVTSNWFDSFVNKVKHSSVCRKVNITNAMMHLNSIDKTRGDDFAYYLQVNRSIAVNVLQFLAVERLVEAEVAGGYKPTSKLYKLVSRLESGDLVLDEQEEDTEAEITV